MTVDSLVTAQMRSIIGRPFRRLVSYPISESDIRKWAIAIHYPESPPRVYWDADHAASTALAELVAPEDFNPFAWATADPDLTHRSVSFDPDYIEATFGIPGPGARTNLNSGLSVTYGVRMHPGDVITSVSRVVSYDEKTGRSGRMLFTTVRNVWTNQHDDTVKVLEQLSIRY